MNNPKSERPAQIAVVLWKQFEKFVRKRSILLGLLGFLKQVLSLTMHLRLFAVSLLHFVFVVIFVLCLANHNIDCYKNLILNIPGTGQQSLLHLMSNTFLRIVYSLYHGLLASSFQLFVHSLMIRYRNGYLNFKRLLLFLCCFLQLQSNFYLSSRIAAEYQR